MENSLPNKNLYLTLFVIGAIFGYAFTLIATWADLEASFYGFDRTGGGRLNTLDCPILMTANESNVFSVSIKNNTDKRVSPTIKTDISTPGVFESAYSDIALNAGETKAMSWQITPENVDLNRFIFIRAWMYAGYPLKDKESTCGVLVLPLPGRGIFYVWAMLVFGALGMGGSLFVFRKLRASERSGSDLYGRLNMIAIIALVGVVVSLAGIWLAGVLVLVLGLLVSVVSIGHSLRI